METDRFTVYIKTDVLCDIKHLNILIKNMTALKLLIFVNHLYNLRLVS